MSNTPYIDVIFGPYEPDCGGLPRQEMPGYLVDALNVRSTPNGYRGMPTFTNVTSAVAISGASSYASGAQFYTDSNSHFFVVTASGAIHESRTEGTSAWEDVSASGTLNPLGDFFRFGDDVVFVSSTRAPIFKDLTTSLATNFASLTGSPPTAATGARVRQHAVLGQLQSSDLYAVRWSAIGNHEDWPTPGTADARSKQAGQESLNPAFGFVQKVLGGEKFGIIVQDRALTRMTYVGGSNVFEFDTYEQIDGYGTRLLARPVTDGKLWYFYSDGGVFATDGYSVKSMSDGKIDEALFLNSISHPNGSSLSYALTSAYDQSRGLVIFGSNENSGGARYQLVLNVADGSFSLINETNEMSLFGGYGDYSAAITGTRQRRYVYNVNASDGKLQRLTAATGSIAMQTGYIEIDPGYNVQLQGAHLLGTGTGSLTLAYKTAATSAACDVLQTGFTSLTAAGLGQKKTARATAQYAAFRVTGTGAESQLIRGIRVYYTRAQPST